MATTFTPDTGGQNVGSIDNQDWIAFTNVNIPTSPNNGGKISLDQNTGATVLA